MATSAERVKTISDEEIVEFCRLTNDANKLHDPEYMQSRGKKAVVPGMLTLGYVLGSARQFSRNAFLADEEGMLEVYFGSPVSSGDTLHFTTVSSGLETRLFAMNEEGNNVLSSANGESRFTVGENFTYHDSFGFFAELPVHEETVEAYADLVGFSNSDFAMVPFLTAYASAALFHAVQESDEKPEAKIRDMVEKKSLPTYASLGINIDSWQLRYGLLGDVGYDVVSSLHGKRDFSFQIACVDSNYDPIFNARYDVKLVPERAVMAMAKDL